MNKYYADGDRPIVSKSNAIVNIYDDLGLMFLIKVKRSEMEKSGARFVSDDMRVDKDGCARNVHCTISTN